MISRTGTTDAIFLYNGKYGVVTDTNGLLYMRARYYSPELRRFINADILMGDINNSTTLNRYAYANGNPISNIDPFGLAVDNRGGNLTKNSKASDLLEIVWDFIKNAVEIEIGTGFGIAGQIDYSGIGIDVNAIVDMPNITISDKGYEEFIKSDISLTVDLFAYEIGPHYTEYDGEKNQNSLGLKKKILLQF